MSREEIVAALKVVLAREGKLTAGIINGARELPSANTVEARLVTWAGVRRYGPASTNWRSAGRWLAFGRSRSLAAHAGQRQVWAIAVIGRPNPTVCPQSVAVLRFARLNGGDAAVAVRGGPPGYRR